VELSSSQASRSTFIRTAAKSCRETRQSSAPVNANGAVRLPLWPRPDRPADRAARRLPGYIGLVTEKIDDASEHFGSLGRRHQP
jgi:hypothetical protein